MVHSKVYLNKYVVSIAPFSYLAFTPTPIQKTGRFCMFLLFNFSSIFPGGVSWPHLPLCADAQAFNQYPDARHGRQHQYSPHRKLAAKYNVKYDKCYNQPTNITHQKLHHCYHNSSNADHHSLFHYIQPSVSVPDKEPITVYKRTHEVKVTGHKAAWPQRTYHSITFTKWRQFASPSDRPRSVLAHKQICPPTNISIVSVFLEGRINRLLDSGSLERLACVPHIQTGRHTDPQSGRVRHVYQ